MKIDRLEYYCELIGPIIYVAIVCGLSRFLLEIILAFPNVFRLGIYGVFGIGCLYFVYCWFESRP